MPPEQDEKPDVDALVAELRAKVEARRSAGQYPPGLEEDLAAHFHRLLARRLEPARAVDLQGPLARVEAALPLNRERIPLESQLPGGAAFHKAVAKLITRQTEGVLQQAQLFAEPVRQALVALTMAVEDLTREVRDDLAAQVAAIVDRQAAHERTAALAAAGGEPAPAQPADGRSAFRPWYSSARFEDEFRGSREDLLARYRDVAERLAGHGPVFDLGCGRGRVPGAPGRDGGRGLGRGPRRRAGEGGQLTGGYRWSTATGYACWSAWTTSPWAGWFSSRWWNT